MRRWLPLWFSWWIFNVVMALRLLVKAIDGMMILGSLAFVLAIASFFLNGKARMDQESIGHQALALGCFFNDYAVFFLAAAFFMFVLDGGWAVWVLWRKDDYGLYGALAAAWAHPAPPRSLASSLGWAMFAVFLLGQLSFHVNHCR